MTHIAISALKPQLLLPIIVAPTPAAVVRGILDRPDCGRKPSEVETEHKRRYCLKHPLCGISTREWGQQSRIGL